VTDPIVAATRFLAGQMEWLRHHPAADEHLDVIERCVRRIRGVVDGPAPKRYLGPCGAVSWPTEYDSDVRCPSDGEMTSRRCWKCGWERFTEPQPCEGDVYGVVGGKTGTCRTCGAQVDQGERRAWLDDQVRDKAFRLAHIADAYRLRLKTLRDWATDRPEVRADNGVVIRSAKPATLRVHGIDRQGKQLFLVGDVLDLAAAAAARRAENEAKRARREDAEVGA
jgi:hypothetical protein